MLPSKQKTNQHQLSLYLAKEFNLGVSPELVTDGLIKNAINQFYFKNRSKLKLTVSNVNDEENLPFLDFLMFKLNIPLLATIYECWDTLNDLIAKKYFCGEGISDLQQLFIWLVEMDRIPTIKTFIDHNNNYITLLLEQAISHDNNELLALLFSYDYLNTLKNDRMRMNLLIDDCRKVEPEANCYALLKACRANIYNVLEDAISDNNVALVNKLIEDYKDLFNAMESSYTFFTGMSEIYLDRSLEGNNRAAPTLLLLLNAISKLSNKIQINTHLLIIVKLLHTTLINPEIDFPPFYTDLRAHTIENNMTTLAARLLYEDSTRIVTSLLPQTKSLYMLIIVPGYRDANYQAFIRQLIQIPHEALIIQQEPYVENLIPLDLSVMFFNAFVCNTEAINYDGPIFKNNHLNEMLELVNQRNCAMRCYQNPLQRDAVYNKYANKINTEIQAIKTATPNDLPDLENLVFVKNVYHVYHLTETAGFFVAEKFKEAVVKELPEECQIIVKNVRMNS